MTLPLCANCGRYPVSSFNGLCCGCYEVWRDAPAEISSQIKTASGIDRLVSTASENESAVSLGFTLNAYQTACAETAVYTKVNGPGARIVYCALALAGEAGEVGNLVKKGMRDEGIDECYLRFHFDRREDHPHNESSKILLELGDTLWYLAMLAKECGFTLEEVAKANLSKLKARYGK